MRWFLVFACLVASTGCIKKVMINNLELAERYWEADLLTVRSRASIDLNCPDKDISVEPLDNFGRQGVIASQVAGRGCGKVAIYTRVNGWTGLALNSLQ